MNSPKDATRRRRGLRVQFSVRTFFVAVTTLSIFIAVKRDWLLSFLEDTGRNVPAKFDFSPQYIRWNSAVGSVASGSPIIADDRIYVGTNNRRGLLERCPPDLDMGALVCFELSTGRLLWQASTLKHSNLRFDWPGKGQRGEPVIKGNRLWYVNNRHELVCLDTEGFYDNEDDGLACTIDRKWDRTYEADVVWRFDMIQELGITPNDICYIDRGNSACEFGDVLLCVTGHCQSSRNFDEPGVDAPSFIAVSKETGQLIWSDSSSSLGSRDAQTGTPVCAILGGVTQAIFPGGDGWLYSFDFDSLKVGKTNLLWKFDCNPKDSTWGQQNEIPRLPLLSQPVIDKGCVYVATGSFVRGGMVPAQMWCIDPTRRGDVSASLVFNQADLSTPIQDKLPSACDVAAGDIIKPNPNSAAVWQYDGIDQSKPSAVGLCSCCNKLSIHNGMLVATDDAGFVHCLDAKTGKQFWGYDLFDSGSGSAVFADEHILITHESGLSTFALSTNSNKAIPALGRANTIPSPGTITATPAIADDMLYVLTDDYLYAIGAKDTAK